MIWGRYPMLMPEGLSTCPEVGLCIPQMIFIRVDFPAPFFPTSPIFSPSLIWKLTWSSRGLWPNTTVRSSTETIFYFSRALSAAS